MLAPGAPRHPVGRALVVGVVACSAIVAAASGCADLAERSSTTGDAGPGVAGSTVPDPTPDAPRLRVEVVARYPHDPAAFTQGLELGPDGTLFESTGRYGSSTVRRTDPGTGDVVAEEELPGEVFGEGLTLVDDELVQLSWKESTAYRWAADTLEQRGTWSYLGEGWGLCDDGDRLVMSDGSAELTLRDRATFAETGRLAVTRAGSPVRLLNELECVDGRVYANVWQTEEIVVIDPSNGTVVSTIDAAGLLTADEAADADVLNGIAYDRRDGTFLVTGKDWPWLFRVRFVPA